MEALVFVASKTVGLAARVETWLTLMMIVALWRGSRGWIFAVLGSFLAVVALPLGAWLAAPLEAKYPVLETVPDGVTGAIVLGGPEEGLDAAGRPLLGASAERLIETARLARQNPDLQMVYTGGIGRLDGQGATGAAVARVFWAGQGLDPGAVIWEDAARTTAENALFSLDMVDPAPGTRWLLVTSARHMPRAMESFARAGWTGLTAWPVDHRGTGRIRWSLNANTTALNSALHEWIGRGVYAALGR